MFADGQTVTFSPGETTKTVSLQFGGSADHEALVALRLTNAVNANVAGRYLRTIRVVAGDSPIFPVVTITAPDNNAVFTAPASLTLSAEASVSSGNIKKVDFYVNDERVVEKYVAPYNWDISDLEAGTYTITAIAYDENNVSGQDEITIKVNIPQGPYDGTPHAIPGTIQFEHFDVGGNGFAYFDDSPGSTCDWSANFHSPVLLFTLLSCFMKHQYRFIVFVFIILCANYLHAQIPAFPGAEGFGKYATGGRGGEVYHVTNLNDSGAGSFRDAVSQPNRIVVFDVGGVIHIKERIVIKKNIYVAGQTAPGGGITIYGNGIAFNGDSGNNIIRYIRFRMGRNGDSKKDAVAISDGQDYMFDHVSISWGIDGTLDVNGSNIERLTFQECIVGQGINIINHSTGGLMQPKGKWSVIRSLYIDNKTRNPKARFDHECINSVLYNWASNGYIMGDTDNAISECNLIGNYFIYGPSSSSNSHITRTTSSFQVYGDDNWVDDNKNGVLDGILMTDYKTATVMSSPFNHPGVSNILSAQDALNHVIENVGASLVRDAVDEYLIDELLSYGTKGKIITYEDDNGIPNNVGTVANGTPPADTDQDGMPDQWEIERGLNPNIADNNGDDDGDGYTNIEEYLSCLVGEGDACSFNPKIDCNGVEMGTAYLDECGDCVGGDTGLEACYIDCNGDKDGTAEVDECGTCSGGNTGVDPCLGALQAEDFCSADGVAESKNTGFIGEGYANLDNATGSSASWYLFSESAQTATIEIRYANGGSSARGMDLLINGAAQASITGSATGGWTAWASETVNIDLNKGINAITLTATDDGGGPNIDAFLFKSSGLSAGSCSTDCNGDVGGSAYFDDCDICVGGNTGLDACIADCNGELNGTAYFDDCNDCVGGNTGKQPCSGEPIILSLKKGWNLIGCPLEGSTAIETVLSSIWDKVEIVKDFDAFYDSSQPAIFNSLTELRWGHGYFVKVSEDCELAW